MLGAEKMEKLLEALKKGPELTLRERRRMETRVCGDLAVCHLVWGVGSGDQRAFCGLAGFGFWC